MKTTLSLAGLGVTLLVGVLTAQTPQQPMPKGQMPDLGRPTRPGDVAPPLDFSAYFPGAWTFEWDVPDGPLGPSGRITGTTIYKRIDDRFFEADTAATGPAGPFKLHETIGYNRDEKFLSRYVTDSRGYAYLQSSPVSGDAGGIYYIYFESSPFTYNGHTIRIKHNLRLLSPLNYRVAISVSDNGGPFVNYGNPWWRKDVGK
ncbi:MAG: DUF1579 domain-containing protein [Acidobacteriia bacterium]|nr:DUF1579 domain-containing protein [Terriglobia bacterium]